MTHELILISPESTQFNLPLSPTMIYRDPSEAWAEQKPAYPDGHVEPGPAFSQALPITHPPLSQHPRWPELTEHLNELTKLNNSFYCDENELLKEDPNKVIDFLKALCFIKKTLSDHADVTDYTLINWAEIYCEIHDINPSFLIRPRVIRSLSKKADKISTGVYLGLSFFGLLVALSKLHSFNSLSILQDETVNLAANSSWNYLDSCGGIGLGIRQIQEGEKIIGWTNIFSNIHLMGCTSIANFDSYLGVSASMAGNLMGFSFAACMAISCGIELYEAEKCERRIQVHQEALSKEKNKALRLTLQQSIIIEKAQAENHRRAAMSWAGCAVAMTIIAFSVSTMGIGLGAAAAIAAFAFVTGCIRAWWVNRVDYVKEAKEKIKIAEDKVTAQPPQQTIKTATPVSTATHKTSDSSLLAQLQQAIDKNGDIINFDQSVTVPGRLVFNSIKMSLHAYLLGLIVTQPAKCKAALKILGATYTRTDVKEITNLYNSLELVLNWQQHFSLGGLTRGAAICRQLRQQPTANPCSQKNQVALLDKAF